jgi:MoaA/NifB/PqqE/SkfB family radical SAM enzyme
MRLLDARIDLDTRCNYHCVYCQNHSVAAEGQTWFPIDKLCSILPVLGRSCWSVYLSCGGEPLLHPRFEEALSIVNKTLCGKDVVIVTNGLALDARKASAILESCVSRVQLSVHTVDPVLYSHLYGCSESDFFRVKNNIENILRTRGGKKWPKILLTAIAMKSTIRGLPDVAKWGVDAGIDGMRVQWLEPFDTVGMDAEVIENSEDVAAKLSETRRILGSKGAFMDWPSSMETKKIMSVLRGAPLMRNRYDYFAALSGKFMASRRKKICHLAGYSFRVGNNGDIKFCHRDALSMPNILENPSVNLSRVFKEAVQNLDCNTNEKCRECPFRP